MAHLIIDGYNLLAAAHISTREKLISLLTTYKKNTGHNILIVFDGTHKGTVFGSKDRVAGIDIEYSPLNETADDVIIGKLNRLSHASSLIVVSSDLKIIKAAHSKHASAIQSEAFVKKLLKNPKVDQPFEKDDSIYQSKPKKGPARKLSKKQKALKRKLGHL